MTGESPTLPTILFRIPPVDVAQATLPEQSTATAPTVSWPLECKQIQLIYKFIKKNMKPNNCSASQLNSPQPSKILGI